MAPTCCLPHSCQSAQHTFFFSSECHFIRSITHQRFRDVCNKLELHHRERFQGRLQSPIFTASWLSTVTNLRNSSVIFRLHRSWKRHLLHELECVDKLVSCSLWRSTRSEDLCFTVVRTILYDEDNDRISPVVLAATCSTPPIALFLLL